MALLNFYIIIIRYRIKIKINVIKFPKKCPPVTTKILD